MSSELSRVDGVLSPKPFSVEEAINSILPRGHAIHGYSSASSRRMLMVLETPEYSDSAPLLGWGVDGNAERALARCLFTYALREQAELQYITETQMPESTQGQIAGGSNNSRFDNIVWGADFTLYQESDVIVASSNYGGEYIGYGNSGTRATGATALEAITNLTELYDYGNASVRRLPAISLE